jgi:hypothetical protein
MTKQEALQKLQAARALVQQADALMAEVAEAVDTAGCTVEDLAQYDCCGVVQDEISALEQVAQQL